MEVDTMANIKVRQNGPYLVDGDDVTAWISRESAGVVLGS